MNGDGGNHPLGQIFEKEMSSGDGESATVPGSANGSITDQTYSSSSWNNSYIFMTDAPTPGGTNGGLIFGIILAFLIFVAALVLVYRRRKYLKKRRNNPYHVPIIEYKEDNISVSTFSSVGYGTYRDLEEYPIVDDVPHKIEGRLTLQGLHDPETTS